MVKDIYDKIFEGVDVRKNLIALKQEIGKEEQKRALAYLLGGDYALFISLLKAEDPKVRKNAALILGLLEDEELKEPLLQAYEREEQEFVKSSYLKALESYDYRDCLPTLQRHLDRLEQEPWEPESEKHKREEMAVLRRMVFRHQAPKAHPFSGFQEKADVILLTNRNHREVTKNQLPDSTNVKMLAGGLKFTTENLDKVLSIRTYQELLFPIHGTALLSANPLEAAEQLASSDLLPFLQRMHRGEPPFYYRIEMKSRMSMDERSRFLKKAAARLDALTHGMLVNLPGGYEAEVRLVENKEGKFVPLLKLYTLKDSRFSYRRYALSSSIAPANAALFMELAREDLREGAQVLDPFCGVGTMLIERAFLKKTGDLYGIDIYEEAVQKGRKNAEHSGKNIHFINRDFFDFQHEYLFDEIVSNLPGITKTKGKEEIRSLYKRFFEKAPEVLKDDGIMLLYSTEPDLFMQCLNAQESFSLAKQWKIQDREASVLFLVKRI